eukprot:jgi/Undpi1/19/HiC_scaffold_1.g00019.m1
MFLPVDEAAHLVTPVLYVSLRAATTCGTSATSQRAHGSNTFNTATNTTNHMPRQAQQQRSYGSTPLVTDASTVDLRSDTVTLPCQRLRAAMAGAKVGDDVFGEDPTVKRLEECVAMLLGKERGLFVPSGSMANLIAVGVHCRRGDELILGNKSHLFLYEAASASAFMGVGFHTLSNLEDGGLDLDGIAGAIRDEDQHFPRFLISSPKHSRSSLTASPTAFHKHPRSSPTNTLDPILRISTIPGVFSLIGARLWNAAVALDVRPSELVTSVDTVSVCLSKGLGAPVGSVLVGSAEFIAEAHRMRKALGGGMRQAGVIAAAGLEAVVNNYTRLQEDHDNAAALASGLAALPGVRTKTRGPSHTNAVYFEVAGITGEALQSVLDTLERDHGVLMLVEIGGIVRAMTNLGVNKEGVERAVEATGIVLAATQATQQ